VAARWRPRHLRRWPIRRRRTPACPREAGGSAFCADGTTTSWALVGAVAFFCLSLTPSLLPRGHILQGLISGITAAVGYGLGVLTVWLIRKLSRRPLPDLTPVAWRWLGGVTAVAIAVFLYLGSAWQHQVHALMGMDPPAQFACSA
jgi:uncharacterized membrane protein